METFSKQDAAERLQSILKQCVEDQQRIRITTEEGNVVLLPEETYEQLMLTLEWLATTSFLPSESDEGAFLDEEALTDEEIHAVLAASDQLAQ
ncbi:MAG: hypothetical protein CMO81_02615 [Waddliaceae bacterium]|nr:hypothetical protein [Waddliaceae bacterium]